MIAGEGSVRAPFIDQVYRTNSAGEFVAYAGHLELSHAGKTWRSPGEISIRLGPRSEVRADFTGSEPWIRECAMLKMRPSIAVPEHADLSPPAESTLATQPSEGQQWASCSVLLTRPTTAGDPREIDRLMLHVTGMLTDYPLPVHVTEDGREQGQLPFTLPGWDLRLVKANYNSTTKTDFTYVIQALPSELPVREKEIQYLIRRVFLLLRLVGSGGIAIGPSVGVRHDGTIAWASWGASRSEPAGPRWCPDKQVLVAVPALADGITALSQEDGLETCVDRAVSLLLATNWEGVLDVKVPIACTGIELLAWAILQHRQWLTPDALNGLTASARARLLLKWAEVPVELPDNYNALAARRRRLGQPTIAGPELIYEIRNKLVHPPKKLSDPEWPAWEEQFEALQLAIWYLELTLLRILGYNDQYASRLKLDAWVETVEPVPWSSPEPLDEPPTAGTADGSS